MPDPRAVDHPLPPRLLDNGLPPEPVVPADQLTYCCGRCGAIVGDAELHALWHVTTGHAQDDLEALTVAVDELRRGMP